MQYKWIGISGIEEKSLTEMDLWDHIILLNLDDVHYMHRKICGLRKEMICVYFKIFITEVSIILSSSVLQESTQCPFVSVDL